MGETTAISWTDSTINVWHGCEKVSPGCKHCYAEVSTPVRVKRAGGLELWGADGARSETKSWERDLRRWNRAAPGKVHRVFAQSLSDTFEDYGGGRVVRADGDVDLTLESLRADFFAVVEECRALTFQLLTKRPENIRRMVPAQWLHRWPSHVWIGTTVEDQERADERIPHLLRVPAAVRFLSVEPQIGPVSLSILGHNGRRNSDGPWVSWIVQGGESGSKARPFRERWMRNMRDECHALGIVWFPKQMGAHVVSEDFAPWPNGNLPVERLDNIGARIIGDGWRVNLRDSHGGDESEWPLDLQGCRAFPEALS